MAKRIPASTDVVVTATGLEIGQEVRFSGRIEAAQRIKGTAEWKYLIAYHDLHGHATAGWYHESGVEVNGQTSLETSSPHKAD